MEYLSDVVDRDCVKVRRATLHEHPRWLSARIVILGRKCGALVSTMVVTYYDIQAFCISAAKGPEDVWKLK
jgi:hypothetical protein